MACVPDDVYRDAVSASPLRVPDDLSVPDESEALRLPPGGAVQQQRSPDSCLEHPPDFFEEQADS